MMNVLKKHGALVAFYLLALLDICFETPFIVRIGLLCLLTVLSFSDDFVFSLPVIILLNDSLGTAFGSSLSFYWVATALIVLRIIYKKHWVLLPTTTLFLAIGTAYCCYSFFFQYGRNFRTPLLIFCYFVLMAFIIEYAIGNNIPTNKIFLAFGCVCILAAIQMAFFGGIAYTTFGYEETNEFVRTTRYGLVGVGVGDPNFSSLRLIFGMICIVFSDINKYLKIAGIGLFLFCIVKTVSLTAFAMLGLVIALIVFTSERGHKIKVVGGILLAVTGAAFIVTVLPLGALSEQISLYQYRLQSVFSALSNGDYSTATTGRAGATLENLKYVFNRNIFKMAFGFDSIPPSGIGLSHNTYVDILVRFGVFGFAIIIILIVKSFRNAIIECIEKHNRESRLIVILKSLFAAYCFTLSIYSGVDVVLLIWIAFIL